MYPVAMLAVICAGGIWNPTPCNLNPTEAGRYFGITCPKLVFCSPDLLQSTREACDKVDIPRSKIYVVSSDPHNISNAETEESLIGHSLLPWTRIMDIEKLNSTPIILHFTSGTTGLPKYFDPERANEQGCGILSL
jgi:acyl-coenzyme A synthetase/AMP-(fatty) acid ligase